MSAPNRRTRQMILDTLKRHGKLTIEGIAGHLGISAVAVRQQILKLQADGIVQTDIQRKGIGRPTHQFRLTAAGDTEYPRTYDRLLTSLLDELRCSKGEQAVNQLFELHRERLAHSYRVRTEGRPLPARVKEIAEIQREAGFMPEVTEESDHSWTITEFNCPLCEVSKKYPTACDQELFLITELIQDAGQVTRTRYRLDGDYVCAFQVTPKSAVLQPPEPPP